MTRVNLYFRLRIPKTSAGNVTENFHNIIEKNSDAIVIVGGNGVVLYVNSSGELLFGRNAEELTGEHFGFPFKKLTPNFF